MLAVYSDERMNWSIFGWTAPSSWIGSIEPIWIILLSPVFAVLWTKLGRRAPTTPRKFAYGVIGMGLAVYGWMSVGNDLNVWLLAPFGIAIGGGVYFVVLLLLRVPELTYAIDAVRRRLRR